LPVAVFLLVGSATTLPTIVITFSIFYCYFMFDSPSWFVAISYILFVLFVKYIKSI
jgi:hypothetical protein